VGLLLCAISINCCMARLQQAWMPFDPYPQQHGGGRTHVSEGVVVVTDVPMSVMAWWMW